MSAEELIPEQNSGTQTNTETEVELENENHAEAFFNIAKERLLHVNGWHEVAGTGTATFRLTDPGGHEVDRAPQPGDHFKIDIPGPGSVTGEGNDWVRVEEVETSGDEVAIRVRPATNPLNERHDVAHFFSEEATSCFMVKRKGNKVIAGVYGRNEKPNTHTEKVVDKVRNAAVAAGAISGFSKLQWKSLVNGLVKK